MDLAAKLQLRPEQGLCPVGAPVGGVSAMDSIIRDAGPSSALLAFVTDRAGLDAGRDAIVAAASADQLTWVAYPKAGQLGIDLNRDSLAAFLMPHGVRPVRQVSVDEVWSALRFRPA